MNDGEACPRIERHGRPRKIFFRVDFLRPQVTVNSYVFWLINPFLICHFAVLPLCRQSKGMAIRGRGTGIL